MAKTQLGGQHGGAPTGAGHGQGNVGSFPKYTGNIISEKVNTSPGVPTNASRTPSDLGTSTSGMPKGNTSKAPAPGH